MAETINALLITADSPSRTSIIEKLGSCDSVEPSAIDFLARALEEKEPAVREAAAKALGKITHRHLQTSTSARDKLNNPALSRLASLALHDLSLAVRLACVQALLQIADATAKFIKAHYTPPPTKVLTTGIHETWKPDPLFHQLPDVLQVIAGYVYPALIAAMNDPSPEVRQAAESLSLNLPRSMVETIRQVDVPAQLRAIEEGLRDAVRFIAYYPSDIHVNATDHLDIYAHLESQLAAIQDEVSRAESALRGRHMEPTALSHSLQLVRGTPITVVPECDGIAFTPLSLTNPWDGQRVRFHFTFTPHATLDAATTVTRVSIQTHGVELARIVCPFQIAKKCAHPLVAAKLQHQTTGLYGKIFVSYSRQDEDVVEVFRLAQLARGDDVFMDTHSLRPGEHWQSALALAIDSADIFQLFWSRNSSVSQNVRDEWKYALEHKCPESKGVGFIRPVFWEDPIPAPPPDELRHLNFRYVPLPRVDRSQRWRGQE